MNPDMRSTLWNLNIRKPMEMILMVFCKQSEEDDQMNTVRKPLISIPETWREWELTLESEEDTGNDNQAYIH